MCLLMILDYYKVIPKINWYDERQYYKRLKSLYIEGTPLSAVAMVLAQSNLETILLHSDKDYFSNKNHYLDDYTYNNSMKEYKMFVDSAKKSGATIKNEALINSDKIKEFLDEDYLITLSGTSGISLHAVLVVGYDKETFCICNPLFKEKQHISKKELNEYMETPIGKWCILVKEKQNEKERNDKKYWNHITKQLK